MPAAAVIPAPIAYIKVVAVKKLVVGSVFHADGSPFCRCLTVMSWYVLPVGMFVGALSGVPAAASSNPVAVLFTECRGGPARLP